jgi:lipoyl(octanoyl) transferase
MVNNREVKYEDLGLIDYKEAWDYQTKLFDEIVAIKAKNVKLRTQNSELPTPYSLLPTPNYLLFCEHPHVYTLGKSGSQENLLIDFLKLKNINATYYKIDRGGDITYHGPGQIVGYPIIDMENFGLGVKNYIYKLEESIILTLAEYNIKSERLEGATGVWIGTKQENLPTPYSLLLTPRKICAIGVRTSRYTTMHGFAFNINTDLNYFNYINPCGFTDKFVTSMEKELGGKQEIEEVKGKLKLNIAKVFGMEFI